MFTPKLKYGFSFVQISKTAIEPIRIHMRDAGYDLFSNEDIDLSKGKSLYVKTGIGINWGRCRDIYGVVTGRSSDLKNNYMVLPGIIDNGYTGDIGVKMLILTDDESFFIPKGTRIAQVVFNFLIHNGDCSTFEDRGNKGFGSSGNH